MSNARIFRTLQNVKSFAAMSPFRIGYLFYFFLFLFLFFLSAGFSLVPFDYSRSEQRFFLPDRVSGKLSVVKLFSLFLSFPILLFFSLSMVFIRTNCHRNPPTPLFKKKRKEEEKMMIKISKGTADTTSCCCWSDSIQFETSFIVVLFHFLSHWIHQIGHTQKIRDIRTRINKSSLPISRESNRKKVSLPLNLNTRYTLWIHTPQPNLQWL